MKSILLAAALCVALPLSAQELEGTYLYQVTTVRATPGEFSSLIADWTDKIANWPDGAGEAPMWMRHSQGDQWDLMFLFPMGSREAYHSADAAAARADAGDPAASLASDARSARVEDVFSFGPPPSVVRPAIEASGLFHVEMFRALPGHREELLAQRRMENVYLAGIERPLNFIFTRESGIAVDAFTLGCHRDLKSFAQSADIPLDVEDRAAREAGFDGVFAISPYLRSLIAEHHDTLAVAIR